MAIYPGSNDYLQDFEKRIEDCHPYIVPGGVAAFVITIDNQEQLAIVGELKREVTDADTESVIRAIRSAVGQSQQQPVYLVALVNSGMLQRTPAGKIKHNTIYTDLISGCLEVVKISRLEPQASTPDNDDLGYVSPRTPVEGALVPIWSSALDVDRLGVSDNFFEMGGDSLMGAQILAQVEDIFQVKFPLSFIFRSPTIATMAEFIDEMRRNPVQE